MTVLPEDDELRDRVRRWIADDPDGATRTELEALLTVLDGVEVPSGVPAMTPDAARADLLDRFRGPLAFGTAGLRGRMGAGESRMNRAVVIRAAAGLAAYLRERVRSGPAPLVVIGYDARYGSRTFAEDTAAVLTAAGCRASLLPSAWPTPVLAFAVRDLDADAGVMVTASHNPPQDNGYKVYLGGRVVSDDGRGAQLVSPDDTVIAARIDEAPAARHVPRAESGWQLLDGAVREAYETRALEVLDPAGARDVTLVVTPLHGVGGEPLTRLLGRAGFPRVRIVAEQAQPDPAFPTVAFPNPEEEGALDLALAEAARVAADLVIANDPDADRCAVAVPPAGAAGGTGAEAPTATAGWRMLTGDELGWLLADRLLRTRGAGSGEGATVACSIVSSRMLGKIAAAHGVRFAETLTGFKWIARVPGLVMGYEEALGFCLDPEAVRDKDGLTAALAAAELAAEVKARGGDLRGELDALARQHGVHTPAQVSVRVTELAEIGRMMQRLRARPPATLGGAPVSITDDLLEPPAGSPLPPTDGIRLVTADATRVIVRPSGTEPKLKCYLEALVERDEVQGRGLEEARREAARRIDAVRAGLPAVLGL